MSGVAVLRAVLARAGRNAQLVEHVEKAWASPTFDGAQHTITLRWAGENAVMGAADFLEGLPAATLPIDGMVLADAAVRAVHHTVLAEPALTAEIALLVLNIGAAA